jgi:hypothetical protein
MERYDLDLHVNGKLHEIFKRNDNLYELQTCICPELNFYRNSINLMIGRRGSGKTYNVFREIGKLCEYQERTKRYDYQYFVYITNKTNDNTYNKMREVIHLPTRMLRYDDALIYLPKFILAKGAHDEVLEKNLQNIILEESRNEILSNLGLDNFSNCCFHTIILYDDAMNIFKTPKYKPLLNLLFENRQSKITYFLCIQDMFGIPPMIKANLDSLWLFGGFKDRQRFNYLMNQLGQDNIEKLFENYKKLKGNDILAFVLEETGVRMRMLICKKDENEIKKENKKNKTHNKTKIQKEESSEEEEQTSEEKNETDSSEEEEKPVKKKKKNKNIPDNTSTQLPDYETALLNKLSKNKNILSYFSK